MAAILMAITLVAGTLATATTTSNVFAYHQQQQKKNKGSQDNSRNNNKNGNTVTIEECKNRDSAGGLDTSVDQEAENTICTHPGSNATCVSESSGAAASGGGGGGGVCNSPLVEAHIGSAAGILICVDPSDLNPPVGGECTGPIGSNVIVVFVDGKLFCLTVSIG
jgi:hypothetical protein